MLSWIKKVVELVANSFSSIGNLLLSIFSKNKEPSQQPPNDSNNPEEENKGNDTSGIVSDFEHITKKIM